MNQEEKTYKIVLVGDANVGKTTFIKRIKTGKFVRKYNSTFGVKICPVTYNTNYGKITFEVWDPAGNELFGFSYNSYYKNACGIIALFDIQNLRSLPNVSRWIDDVYNIAPAIPFGIYGNKADKITEYECEYSMISVKKNINLDIPFLHLARQLTGHDDLVFIL